MKTCNTTKRRPFITKKKKKSLKAPETWNSYRKVFPSFYEKRKTVLVQHQRAIPEIVPSKIFPLTSVQLDALNEGFLFNLKCNSFIMYSTWLDNHLSSERVLIKSGLRRELFPDTPSESAFYYMYTTQITLEFTAFAFSARTLTSFLEGQLNYVIKAMITTAILFQRGLPYQ